MASIRKRGKNYQAVIRRAGWPQQSCAFPTKKLAQEWARDVEHKMDRGVFQDQATAKSTTLNELIERYLTEVVALKRKPKPIEVDTCILKRIQREEWQLCSLTLDKLKPRHFNAYRDKRAQTPSPYKLNPDGTRCCISHSAIVRELSLLTSVIQHDFINLGIPFNPASGKYVKRPIVSDGRDVRLSDSEKVRLINGCYAARNSLIGPFVEMGFETGARRGEILSLRWDDVDLKTGTALLRDVKNTRNPDKIVNRSIGLSTRAREILSALPRRNPNVFPMTANAFRLSFARVRKNLSLTHFHFHDTRHDFVSRMVEAKWAIALIMAQVGHTSTKSLERYMTIQPGYLASELSKLASATQDSIAS